MYCKNNFNGKYWAIVGSNFPDCRGPDYRGTTEFIF